MLWNFFRKRALAGSVWLLQSGSFPEPLTKTQETYYVEKFKNGDEAARNILIERNLRLVAHIVKKYSAAGENDDLISIGTIGLIKGISSYNTDKKTKLATYVARCIENSIRTQWLLSKMVNRNTKAIKRKVAGDS